MRSLPAGASAVIVGASGGIGSALVTLLLADPGIGVVHAMHRGAVAGSEGRLVRVPIDVTDAASIAHAAGQVRSTLRLIIVATGVLQSATLAPEKTYRALDGAALIESYRVNVVGPALVARHFLPLMAPDGRTVFAALSARVGSIGDNQAGGWHAYRASKAALNMIIRNLAIEVARRTPDTLCVGLHPGTVDTGLSHPFQRNVPPERLFTPVYAATRLLSVIDDLTPADSGCVLAWDGSRVPP